MGEAKQRRDQFEKLMFELSDTLLEEGLIVQAGFAAYRDQVMSKDAPPVQVKECGMAFMAGAQHVFGSMMTLLDPSAGVTAEDERRMALMFVELDDISKQLAARHYPTRGTA